VEPAFLPKNQAYSYPPPFTRYKMASAWYRTYPQSTVGKIFFQKRTGSSWYVCSGAVAVRRAVWTAGHCVYTPGSGWHRNMTFYPAYKNGADPVYGGWTVTKKATLNGWISNKLPYDIGMMVVKNKGGKMIAQVTGWLCASWGGSSRRHWTDFGYPQSSPFNGKYQYVCAASRAWQDARQGTPWTNGIGCDMTGGCSGGPWLYKYAPGRSGAVNCVNSVNSYRYTRPSQKKAIHGPYFGDGAKNLYNWGKTK
jgi:V8-like Glu-specific endopeptidase